jgi:hypothetical protein
MKFLWNWRRLAGIGAVGAAVATTLFVVLPAVASTPGDYVKPASVAAGVLPYDAAFGGNGACSNLFTGAHVLPAGVREYDNNNPKTTAFSANSGNGDGVTFDLNLHNPSNTSQTLDVTGHGAAIVGIGIKGGTQTAAYDYFHGYPGVFVTGDTGLHAPLQNNSYTTTNVGGTVVETGNSGAAGPFYSISLLNVCYVPVPYIQGTVYHDNNQNGTNDDSSAAQGWTVNLYSGVSAGVAGGGTVVKSQHTGPDGKYHFDLPAVGTTYRVCEAPGETPPAGSTNWVESQPRPSSSRLCTGANELPKGYDVTPTLTTGVTDDFGNVGGVACPSAGSSVGSGPYTVGTCKENQLYVFNSGTNNGMPFVDYWVGDPTQASIPVVEQINFDDPFVNGSPTYTKLLYADGGGFPPSFDNLLTMPNCLLDPRDPVNSDGFNLATAYSVLGGAGSVIPSFSQADNRTSCVISIKVTAPLAANQPGKLQAYVYSLGDAVRGAGG